MSSKSPLPERQFARSSQGCAFLFLKISKFSGGSVSVFSKIQNLAVAWGMKNRTWKISAVALAQGSRRAEMHG
jgi:hypothetical protein